MLARLFHRLVEEPFGLRLKKALKRTPALSREFASLSAGGPLS
ncbi:hypothetical protein ACF1BE_26835 [Streptomyces sp. NPDC014991]